MASPVLSQCRRIVIGEEERGARADRRVTEVMDPIQTLLRHDPQDADVLIAMHRIPDADEDWRNQTLEKIQQAGDYSPA